MNAKSDLAQKIRISFGTSHSEPNSMQLEAIISELENLSRQRVPTNDDWRNAVYRHCPSAGQYTYKGLDNSDLNSLLQAAARENRNPTK